MKLCSPKGWVFFFPVLLLSSGARDLQEGWEHIAVTSNLRAALCASGALSVAFLLFLLLLSLKSHKTASTVQLSLIHI